MKQKLLNIRNVIIQFINNVGINNMNVIMKKTKLN